MPRQIFLGQEQQRPDEQVPYGFTIDASYASPSTAVAALWDVTEAPVTDVTSTKLSGSASLTGQSYTSPLVINVVAGRTYRLELRFTSGGAVYEPYFMIEGKA